MQLLILVSFIILFFFIISKRAISFLKSNLVKDQRTWSGKDIKINRKDINPNNRSSSSNTKNNYLELIAEESKIFLDEQS